MDIFSLSVKLSLGFILGAVIGLEREVNEKKSLNRNKQATAIVGLRSFSLTAVLGVIVGLLYTKFLALSLLIGLAFFILLILFYFFDTNQTKDHGITSELAVIYSFLIGVLLAVELIPVQLIIAITILVTLVLSQKEMIKGVVGDIHKTELNAFIGFAIIALVILPFLPNTSFAVGDIPGIKNFLQNIHFYQEKIVNTDIINPFKLWLIVALITGVDLLGFILEKVIGQKRGWLLTSAVGGFVSSTATTQSIAQESRKRSNINSLLSAAVLANMVSFFQIALLIGALNAILFIKLVPILTAMVITASVIIFYFIRKKEQETTDFKQTSGGTIIDISSALKFAFLFLAISIFSKIALEIFGNSGLIAATAIGALIGLDAVMINTAQLAGTRIDFALGILAFILANAVNLLAKSFYCFMTGKKEFAVKFLISMIIIITASIIPFIIFK